MKTMKYFLSGLLMLSLSMPVAAQSNNPLVDEATALVKNNTPAKEVKAFAKKNKKSGEVITAIGRAYYELKDTVSAREYAEMAAQLKYSGGYVLLGDLASQANDAGQAAIMYENAIYADPKNAIPYLRYAVMYSKVDPNGSIAKLEELRTAVPDYPVDLPIARFYVNAGKKDDAIRHFDRVDRSAMDAGDLASYALMNYLNKDYPRSLSIVNEALKEFPRSSSLNRIGLMNTIAQEDYDQALVFGDHLFNQSDSANYNDFDYTNYAKAYIGKGQFDDAIALYRKGMEVSSADKDAVNNLYKEISDAYMKKGDFDNAVKEYKNYLDGTSKKTASDYSALAEMYYKHAADLTGDEQMASIKSADEIYADVQQRFQNNADVLGYVLNRRGTLNAILDPTSEQGLAKPVYEELMKLIEATEERTPTDTKRLITCYRYMLSYDFTVLDNKEAAKDWAQKILDIDPENEQAKAVIENIK